MGGYGDRREYHECVCWICLDLARWLVYEDRDDPDSEWLMACERHRWTAFS